MIIREPTRKGDKVKVTFVLSNDSPGDVFVAGDFNAWNPGATLLRRRGEVRNASLTLTAGKRYAFRYYGNGGWFNEEKADDYEHNDYGETNGIVDLTDGLGECRRPHAERSSRLRDEGRQRGPRAGTHRDAPPYPVASRSMSGAHHLRGVLLPEAEERDLWIVDGRITFESVPDTDTLATSGWVLPGLVDAQCHIGLGPGGAVEDVTELQDQARADTFAGALLVRDAGSPVDTRLLDGEPDVPRIVRCGRHIARPKRCQPGVVVEVDPEELPAAVAEQAAAGASWVKLVGDWIDRTEGDLAPLWPADALKAAVEQAHDGGARVREGRRRRSAWRRRLPEVVLGAANPGYKHEPFR